MADDGEDRNNCCICLCSLAQPDAMVAACVPCGHCFHQDCITPWFQSTGKCALCNERARSIQRIYIDLSNNDVIDISSDEEDSDVEKQSSSDEASVYHDTAKGDGLETQTTIGSSPLTNRIVSECNSRDDRRTKNVPSAKGERKKRKILKKRVRYLETERNRLQDDRSALQQELKDCDKDFEDYRQKMCEVEHKQYRHERDMQELRCEGIQLKGQLEKANDDCRNYREKYEIAKSELDELGRKFQAERESSRKNLMAESQRNAKEIPRLQSENRDLRAKLQKLEKQLGQQHQSTIDPYSAFTAASKAARRVSTSNSRYNKAALKEIDRERRHHAQYPEDAPARDAASMDATLSRVSASTLGLFIAATEKNKRKKNKFSRNAVDLLNAADTEEKTRGARDERTGWVKPPPRTKSSSQQARKRQKILSDRKSNVFEPRGSTMR